MQPSDPEPGSPPDDQPPSSQPPSSQPPSSQPPSSQPPNTQPQPLFSLGSGMAKSFFGDGALSSDKLNVGAPPQSGNVFPFSASGPPTSQPPAEPAAKSTSLFSSLNPNSGSLFGSSGPIFGQSNQSAVPPKTEAAPTSFYQKLTTGSHSSSNLFKIGSEAANPPKTAFLIGGGRVSEPTPAPIGSHTTPKTEAPTFFQSGNMFGASDKSKGLESPKLIAPSMNTLGLGGTSGGASAGLSAGAIGGTPGSVFGGISAGSFGSGPGPEGGSAGVRPPKTKLEVRKTEMIKEFEGWREELGKLFENYKSLSTDSVKLEAQAYENTSRFKAIQGRVSRIEQVNEYLNSELTKVETEQKQMEETLKALDQQVDRILSSQAVIESRTHTHEDERANMYAKASMAQRLLREAQTYANETIKSVDEVPVGDSLYSYMEALNWMETQVVSVM